MRRLIKRLRRPIGGGERGFTLLEVMVALAILALSLTVISEAETNSVRAIGRAKAMTIATMLARHKMVEVEDELFEEGFSDFEEEDKGDFNDEGFKHFKYTVKIDKVELPANINAESMSQAVTGADSDGDSSGSGGGGVGAGILGAGAKMMAQSFELFRNVLEQSIRRVSIKVSWFEGKKERFTAVTAYFTDPRKIDAVTGGLGALGGAIPGAKPGTTPGAPGSSTPATKAAPRTTNPAVPR